MKTFIKEPLLHFLLLGAGLFLLFGWKSGPASLSLGQSGTRSMEIMVTQNDIDQLVDTFTRTWQRSPTESDLKNLVDSFIRDEIYFREAVAAGLTRNDSVIRRRMRLKMEFIFENIAAQKEPTDTELLAYMKQNPDAYLADPIISFRHIYIATDRQGHNAEAFALDTLAKLREGADPALMGDPFLLNTEMESLPLRDIRNQFGETFSNKLLELDQGKWQGPVQSGFGLHLVFVKKRTGAKLPEFGEVRDIVRRDWMAEQQKEIKDAAYAKLKERYTVVIEKPKPAAPPKADEADMKTVIR